MQTYAIPWRGPELLYLCVAWDPEKRLDICDAIACVSLPVRGYDCVYVHASLYSR